MLLTAEEVAGFLHRAGWKDFFQLMDAIRIAFAESSENQYVLKNGAYQVVGSGGFLLCDASMVFTNTDGSRDRGLMQVNDRSWAALSDADAANPARCANFAYTNIWLPREKRTPGSGFMAWSSFNKQPNQIEPRYQQYYAEAASGAAAYWLHSKGRPFIGLQRGTGGS